MANYLIINRKTHKTAGFTLVELSIVIVIIALIVAAVSAGQSLVKSSRLRSIISEVNQYKNAYNAFKLEYYARPGDIDKATSYWTGTTDGNANGQIMDHMSESVYAWQHLALARLIPGTYTGVQQEIGNAMIGLILPTSNFSSTSSYQFFYGVRSGWSGSHSTEGNNFLRAGGIYTPGAGDRVGSDTFTPKESQALDDKMDDGLPGLGLMYVRSISGTCTTTLVTTTGIYNLATTGKACYLNFIFD